MALSSRAAAFPNVSLPSPSPRPCPAAVSLRPPKHPPDSSLYPLTRSSPPLTRSAPELSMMSEWLAASLNPPALQEELDASAGLPPHILLATRVYFARRNNSTTISANISRGQSIEVSICFAAPPAISYVCIYCPELKEGNFKDEPRVVRVENQFLLLHFPLCHRYHESREYLLYKAAPGSPSLRWIPDPGPRWVLPDNIGICCCADGGYTLAALCPPFRDEGYKLYTFSSKSDVWTAKPARLEKNKKRLRYISTDKVLQLGESLLGWVDLVEGILMCDIASEDCEVVLSDIPLPKLMPENNHQNICGWKIRDVICYKGFLKFIEIEDVYTTALTDGRGTSVQASDLDVQYDDSDSDDSDSAPCPRTWVGWRAVIWNRMLSEKLWIKGCGSHIADILAKLGDGSVEYSTLMNLVPIMPALSILGNHVVYINSVVVNPDIEKSLVITVDIKEKTLISLASYPPARTNERCPHFSSVLSTYFNKAPALPQIVQTSNFKNVTANQSLSCAEEQLLPVQQQTTWPRNWPQLPSWISTGLGGVCSANAHLACPAINRATFGGMVHPAYQLLIGPPLEKWCIRFT